MLSRNELSKNADSQVRNNTAFIASKVMCRSQPVRRIQQREMRKTTSSSLMNTLYSEARWFNSASLQYYWTVLRALCEDPKIIQKWFNDLKELRFTKGILDEDIYNFDKTGFAMGWIGTTKVVSRSNMPGRPLLIQPGSREWVTTIECINTRGWSVLTCIIFKGKAYIKGWYAE